MDASLFSVTPALHSQHLRHFHSVPHILSTPPGSRTSAAWTGVSPSSAQFKPAGKVASLLGPIDARYRQTVFVPVRRSSVSVAVSTGSPSPGWILNSVDRPHSCSTTRTACPEGPGGSAKLPFILFRKLCHKQKRCGHCGGNAPPY